MLSLSRSTSRIQAHRLTGYYLSLKSVMVTLVGNVVADLSGQLSNLRPEVRRLFE
jgi:hypothetical protein